MNTIKLSPHTKVLIYDLTDTDACEAARMAENGLGFWGVIWDMDQWLRERVKWAPADQPEQATAAYQAAREQLHSFLGDRGLTLE